VSSDVNAERKTDLLVSCPLFERLPRRELDDLAARTVARRCRRGQLLFSEGDPGDSLLLAAEGRLKILTRGEDGGELLLAVIGPSESIGALSLADGGPRSATVEALTDAVVLRIDRADIAASGVSDVLARMLADVVRRLTGTAADLVFLDLPRRLAKLLILQRQTAGDDLVKVPWTQTDMASAIGASRQSVNSALHDFQARGWIVVQGPRLRVRDPEALTRFAA
jgi:CRP-like cAMP-binding protein